MKLKKILSIVLVIVTTFVSCSKEESLEKPDIVKEGIPTSLSLVISAGEVTTKTLPLGTEIDTSVEKKIETLAIVVFKNDGKTYLGHQFATFADEDAIEDTEHAGRKAYKIGGIPAETGKVIVMGIANSSKFTTEADFDAFVNASDFNYTKFKEESEDTYVSEYAFDSSTLVKFVEKTIDVSPYTKSYHIEMTQLAARITVNVKTAGYPENENWYYLINKVEIDGLQLGSNVFLDSGTTASGENTSLFGTKKDQWEAEEGTYIQSFSFYTYERKTTPTPLKVQLSGTLYEQHLIEGSMTPVKDYSKEYTLNINPKIEGDCKTAGIVHGNAYEITGVINIETMNITFSTAVVSWDDKPIFIGGDILDLHYLFVEEHDVTMTNTGEYAIRFKADLTVSTLSITDVYCYYTGLKDGSTSIVEMKRKDYEEGDEEFPDVYVNNGTKQIEITSSKPINYAPKYFTFTVTNNMGLEETVTVTQYPPVYITGRKSNGVVNDLQSDGANNPNLFTVTFVASTGYPLGNPMDPTTKRTKTDAASNELISPKFVIASRYAVTSSTGFSSSGAPVRCDSYYEDEYNKGGWRVPTIAELEFLSTVQHDSNSAIRYLFGMVSGGQITKMSRYWSALPNWVYDFDNEVRTNSETQESQSSKSYYGGIRCVKDLF